MSTRQLRAPSIAGLEWGRIAKRLFVVPILFLSFSAHAFEWCGERELNILGLSAHFYETKYSTRRGWNELNFGLGLTCHLGGAGLWKDEAEVGVFRNSYRRTSVYAGYGVYYPLTPVLSAGFRAVVANGYPQKHGSGIQAGLMPALKVKLTESIALNISARPIVKPFFCANLGVKF